jgi:negative regulator of sigma E activity
MTDWIEKLSDYVDGDLPEDEVAQLESALDADPDLRTILEEVRAVKRTAAGLPVREPEADLWPGIMARIEAEGSPSDLHDLAGAREARRRISLSIPQFAAAAVILLFVGSASVWIALGQREPVSTGEMALTEIAPEAGFVALPSSERTEPTFDAAILELESQLKLGRERLDPSTVEALERSLATIDRAIARAQEALDADPASVYLNRHLADAKTRKIHVLQQAAILAST